jgi:hypothetical protein
MNSTLRIIVTGLIAQHPTLGGVTWDYLQYVLGLAHLGHDVYYFEDTGQWPYNPDGGASRTERIAYDPTANVSHLAKVMARYGLADKWAYHFPINSTWYGVSDKERRLVVKSADLLINVSGTLKRPQDYREVHRLVYIDSDPVFTQVKLKLLKGQMNFRTRLQTHDIYFSFGECFSEAVPGTREHWRPTRQPIVLSEWRPSTPQCGSYTTVMNWASYKPLSYHGQMYGQKDVEFKRFLELPQRVHPVILEVALGKIQHLAWERSGQGLRSTAPKLIRSKKNLTTRDVLSQTGWRVVEATEVCRDLNSYRQYIESSKAEWSVAKNGYVVGQSGWFSCRSACYLAAGRPVVVQDTGFASVLPVGEGIVPFTSMEEAVAGIREVEANYTRHAKAARAIAVEYFDSDKVLTQLLEEAMNCNAYNALLEISP